MNQNNKKVQEASNLLVICHDEENFQNVSEVLSHYFPNQTSSSTLLISNKYYKAQVKLHSKFWTHVFNSKQSDNQQTVNTNDIIPSTVQKYDLMIMLVNEAQQNSINFQSLDLVIQTFNPEEFVLLINTTTPEDPWAHQETILQKCNNFIEIVKDDLWKINKTRPTWSRGALLNNQEETDDSSIFSILDRMETTRWSTMVSVKQDKFSQKKTQSSEKMNFKLEQVHEQSKDKSQKNNNTTQNFTESKPTQPIKIESKVQPKAKLQTKTKQADNQSSEEQKDEKRLEQEMREFQNMMGQMMSFKMQSAAMKTQQRKQKAEQLFFNMFKGMINDSQE